MAKSKTSTKTQVTKRGDQAPEAKKSAKAKSSAADKLFKDADEAARHGLHPDITREQRETMARRAALGY